MQSASSLALVSPFTDTLVADVQQAIVEFLPLSDLLSLSLVSKYLNVLTTPHIYHTIVLLVHAYSAGFGTETDDEEIMKQQIQFFVTITNRPELAGFVKEIHWTVFSRTVSLHPLRCGFLFNIDIFSRNCTTRMMSGPFLDY